MIFVASCVTQTLVSGHRGLSTGFPNVITLIWGACFAVVAFASCSVCPDCLDFYMRILGDFDIVPFAQRHLWEAISIGRCSTHTAACRMGVCGPESNILPHQRIIATRQGERINIVSVLRCLTNHMIQCRVVQSLATRVAATLLRVDEHSGNASSWAAGPQE